MTNTTQFENKMVQPTSLENKGHCRVPTGQIDAEVRVRAIQEEGAPDKLDVRMFRRSPADLSDDAFRPTAAGITLELQFADVLLEQIAKARDAATAPGEVEVGLRGGEPQ
jgi:hypothetical protein